MSAELAQPAMVPDNAESNRSHRPGISECTGEPEANAASRKESINWDGVLGLTTVVVVSVGGWTAAGMAVAHFIR